MNKVCKMALVSILGMCVVGCATPEQIVLLPQPDGSSSGIVVHTSTEDVTLDKPYAAVAVTKRQVKSRQTNEAAITEQYRALYEALPPRPRSYLLYFESGGDKLTSESLASLEGLLNDLKSLPAAEVLVIGHTDKVGSDELNDKISEQRADLIRTLLLEQAGESLRIEAVGRGKRDPMIPTEEGVDEPRNRRVEVRLR